MDKKIKITLIAEDRIGRKEYINLMVDELTKEKLVKAAANKLPDGRPESELLNVINDMADFDGYQHQAGAPGVYFSKSQLRRLEDFFNLIYHKFYNYHLTIDIKKGGSNPA